MGSTVTILTPGGPMDIPAELLPNAGALSEYMRDQASWDTRAVAEREQEMALMDTGGYTQTPAMVYTPPRQKASLVDSASPTIPVAPQRWATATLAVAAGSPPVQLWPSNVGMASIVVMNSGANPVVIGPDEQTLNNGNGYTLAAGAEQTLSVQRSGWVSSPQGSTVQVLYTWYESSGTHLPPKLKDNDE